MGICALITEALKIDAMGAVSSTEKSLRSQFGMESGPDDLDFLIALRQKSTSFTEM